MGTELAQVFGDFCEGEGVIEGVDGAHEILKAAVGDGGLGHCLGEWSFLSEEDEDLVAVFLLGLGKFVDVFLGASEHIGAGDHMEDFHSFSFSWK